MEVRECAIYHSPFFIMRKSFTQEMSSLMERQTNVIGSGNSTEGNKPMTTVGLPKGLFTLCDCDCDSSHHNKWVRLHTIQPRQPDQLLCSPLWPKENCSFKSYSVNWPVCSLNHLTLPSRQTTTVKTHSRPFSLVLFSFAFASTFAWWELILTF